MLLSVLHGPREPTIQSRWSGPATVRASGVWPAATGPPRFVRWLQPMYQESVNNGKAINPTSTIRARLP